MLDGSGTDYVITSVYDGWNQLKERREEAGKLTTKNFVWGLDLSQSMNRAGSIGALLAVIDEAGIETGFFYDANGNVGQLVDKQNGVVARYEYDVFGNVIVAEGHAANENTYRFSSKEFDDETGLSYFGERFYAGLQGRWLNRDSVGGERRA